MERTRIDIINGSMKIGSFWTDDIVMQCIDTFGVVKKLTDRMYHGCDESDKGTCFCITTRSDGVTTHVFPKDCHMIFRQG